MMDVSAVTISARKMLEHARAGCLSRIALDESKLDAVVDYVIETTRMNYPALDIPFLSLIHI